MPRFRVVINKVLPLQGATPEALTVLKERLPSVNVASIRLLDLSDNGMDDDCAGHVGTYTFLGRLLY